MSIKNILLKIKFRYFPHRITPAEFNNILKKTDIDIGKGTYFFDPNTTVVDGQRSWMLHIGDYCKITRGTIILQHDYSRSVLRRKYNDILCEAGETVIGNNVFIGMNSIILMGTHIGDNVIVGAGSVVSGNFPDNVVIAGNPAKIIRTLDEHYKIRKNKYIEEAKLYARTFYKKYNRNPEISEMGAFFPIFLERDINKLKKYDIKTAWNGDEESEIIESFIKSRPIYSNYKMFLEDAYKED